jgi:hypothetical protein
MADLTMSKLPRGVNLLVRPYSVALELCIQASAVTVRQIVRKPVFVVVIRVHKTTINNTIQAAFLFPGGVLALQL